MQNNGDHDDESKTSLTIESKDASTIRPAIRPMRRHVPNEDMMGSLVRHRRRVVSLPLGDRTFFHDEAMHRPLFDHSIIHEDAGMEDRKDTKSERLPRRRQPSHPPKVVNGILRRKQVSLDLLSPQAAAFFAEEEEQEEQERLSVGVVEEEEEDDPFKDLFFPLKFAPAKGLSKKKKISHEDEEVAKKEESEEEDMPPDIIRATRIDKIKALVLLILMITFVGVCIGWKTHEDESHSIFGLAGIACVTPCYGDVELRNFFIAHEDHFHKNDVIGLTMHLDPIPNEEDVFKRAKVEIIRIDKDANGLPVQTLVKTVESFGPPDEHHRETFEEKIEVDWEYPEHHHIINVISESGDPLSFTLAATKQSPLSKHSILIAALIMVFVYIFILLEVIHRTLVSVFGSMIALFFFFLMHDGDTESIKTIMLHQEWSTLGLLFGMMIIVGELSHTGVFEWFAVRILVQSKGSFNRLLVLLCLLTAVASAFLDNVTTMLLLAPVTIDMAGILGVDPRPYLISEVILSNIGGTATLIGDPPNIIIGASFDEVGFVDFIVNIMPCIFLIIVPVSLALSLWIYKPYTTFKDMPPLDVEKLKKTYPVYDEPRLLLSGTSCFFLIVLFFLHPLHHKDTAWLALISAFLTISFTNPHDVQDVLRNHVEWDTLLFFAGLFVLVEVCAAMGLLEAIGGVLASLIKAQSESQQLPVAITLLLWVSAFTSAFLDNIPYTATMIPVLKILASELPETLPLKTLAWALSFGACLGGNGTLLGASANIVTAGISTNRGLKISFINFLYPGMLSMIIATAIANLYMMVVYVWV
jgi:Na+/H+ antiporter NhaD/arsenite permease-like protein